ncbi:MAG: CoA transferase [Actinobacteria bacterium]|nr:CoA transferase [Actinomycetota bacterium]MBV9933120.1 CoA transferase [Actinomycetota bacterium]
MSSGPLAGVRIVEMAGLGPAPFAGMLLADMGAELLRVDKPPSAYRLFDPTGDVLGRGRRSIAVDVKHPEGTEVVLRLIEQADVLLDPYRPGVLERLGLGPDVCLARNPRLVYGRMTGFGQPSTNADPSVKTPLTDAPGHDINYIAIGGALGQIGRQGEPPTPPLNLVGDFGGGGMLLVVGVLAALLHARATGDGQVVDAAMVDGTAMLLTSFFDLRDRWKGRGTNTLDSGAPFYDVYETADGRFVAVGAMEAQFFAALVKGLDLDDSLLAEQWDQSKWPEHKRLFTEAFKRRTRDEWCALLEGGDACVSPVLDPPEVMAHPHHAGRGTYVQTPGGPVQPAPAPRFEKTPSAPGGPPPAPGQHSAEALADWGFAADEIAALQDSGAVC